jgi:predicted DsbA family dithiol-disulfide isomerase
VSATAPTATAIATDERLRVDLWTDLGCPWCYVGKHRLEDAIEQSGLTDRVDIVLHSFELDPATPDEPISIPEIFVKKHGGTAENAVRMEEGIRNMANAEGLPFTIDRLHANTFTTHRVLKLAEQHGVANRYFTVLQRGHFSGELNPFDPETLVSVAVDAGVPEHEVREVIASEAFADEVRRDEADGQALGITGVPLTVFDERLAAAGAQSVDVYRAALEQAFGDRV